MLTHRNSACLAMLLALAASGAARAQSTAFTYQGRLRNGTQPATGLHDFRFRLWDAASGGTQLGTNQCADNVSVAEGIFSTTIDFGHQYAAPNTRFLEIEVRADTGLNCGSAGGFVVLAPRQPLTATPLASHAKSAFTLAAADGSPADAVVVDNSGNAGIGTAAPAGPVHVARDIDPIMILQDTGPASTQAGYLTFWNSTPTETAWVGFGTPGSPHFSVVNARSGGNIALLPLSGGNVGVGTAVPAAKLDVRGDIRLGASGQLLATGGHEGLRILRGFIGAGGQVAFGQGFSASRLQTGEYSIVFDAPFSSIPMILANCDYVSGQPPVVAMPDSLAVGSATIVLQNLSGAKVDSGFHFMAVARP